MENGGQMPEPTPTVEATRQRQPLRGDDLLERLLDFSARVGTVVDALPDTRLGRHIAGQLVRSGTSPSPNYNEGRNAESRDDFIHKLSIALKELSESEVWLKLIVRAKLLPEHRLDPLADEAAQLGRILAQSIITAKKNHPNPRKR
jgi:four helix bundle protein